MSDELVLSIVVLGEPQPQGSASAWVPTDKQGNPYRRKPTPRNPKGPIIVNVTSDNSDLKKWRELVESEARAALAGRAPTRAGYTLELVSYLKRKEGDWGTGRNAHLLKPGADAYPLVNPDADKLLRGVFDALTKVIYDDDSNVTDAITRKRFAVPTFEGVPLRAEIKVWLNAVQTAADLPQEEQVRQVPGREAPADDLALPV